MYLYYISWHHEACFYKNLCLDYCGNKPPVVRRKLKQWTHGLGREQSSIEVLSTERITSLINTIKTRTIQINSFDTHKRHIQATLKCNFKQEKMIRKKGRWDSEKSGLETELKIDCSDNVKPLVTSLFAIARRSLLVLCKSCQTVLA